MNKILLLAIFAFSLTVNAEGRNDRGNRGSTGRGNSSVCNSRNGSCDTRGTSRTDRTSPRSGSTTSTRNSDYNRNSGSTRYNDYNRDRDRNTNYNDGRSRDGSYDTRGTSRYDRTSPRYSSYRHTPNRTYTSHTTRYYSSRDYQRNYRNYVYQNRWLRITIGHSNGYYFYNDYPFYVYNGYSHRYSNYDNCDYELVDSYTNRVERTFYAYSCSMGYDMCADQRDDLNDYEWDNRYFCAEKYEY